MRLRGTIGGTDTRRRPRHECVVAAVLGVWLGLPTLASASLLYKQGSFAKTTAAAPVPQSITGVGFQPKAVLFYWTKQTATGLGNDVAIGYGFATGPAAQRAIAGAEVDGLASAASRQSRTRSIVMVDAAQAPAFRAEAQLTSFDPDGFTLNWTTNAAPAVASIIHFIALGGPDLASAVASDFTNTLGAGAQGVTGLGFRPDFLMFLSIDQAAMDTTNASVAQLSWGLASGPAAQGGIGVNLLPTGGVPNPPNPPGGLNSQRTDNAIVELTSTGSAYTKLAALQSFDVDGFTINKTTSADATPIHFLALKGGRYKVGNFLSTTNMAVPVDQAVTGVGFPPIGVALVSAGKNVNPGINTEAHVSFGGADPFGQGAIWFHQNNGFTTAKERTSTTSVMIMGGAATLDSEANRKSLDPGGFTLTWTTQNNALPREILYAAFGSICCTLTTTQSGTQTTVDTPDVKMVWDSAANAGGGLSEFYQKNEANPGVNRSGNLNPYNVFSTQVNDTTWHFEGVDAVGGGRSGSVQLLEATSTRVKVRQKYAYTGNVRLQRDWTAYGNPRLAIDEKLAVDATQALRGATGLHPKGETTCPGNTFYCAGNSDQANRIWVVTDNASTYSDMLGIAFTTPFFGRPNDWETLWEAGTPNSFFSRVHEPTQISTSPGTDEKLYLVYPSLTGLTSAGTEWQPYADDYRNPSALTINGGKGSQWQDAAENTGAAGDFFNEAEDAYLVNINPATGLDVDIDGSAFKRKKPFFKIRQWRSFAAPGTITLEGTSLTNGVDYRADVKPISRGHFTPSLRWHCSMESQTACTPPGLDVGTGGNMSTAGVTGPLVQAGKYGNAAVFNEDQDNVSANSADFTGNIGTVEFWYQPFSDHDDGFRHLLWYTNVFSGGSNCYYIEKTGANQLQFVIRTGASNTACTTGAPAINTAATSGNFRWRAGDWVHIAATWDSAAGLKKMRLFIDGVEVGSSNTFASPGGSGTPNFGGCTPSFSCPTNISGNANGAIDEPSLYQAAPPQLLANGGLTSDTTNEWLADTTRDFSFVFQGLLAGQRGPYLFLGADSKFLGLNVVLRSNGVGVLPDDLMWEYWDGTTGEWEALVRGGGLLVDDTNSFTKSGNVYWTAAQVAGWRPFSVNGSPDLYYVRAYLKPGASYSGIFYPQEGLIKTDILLLQYCGDITLAAQTLQIAPPVPTAVTLQSFTATGRDGAVDLSWATASELQNLGFHLYRADSADGPYARITSSLIPGLGSSPTGQSYGYRDAGLVNGRTYYYELEDVETTGKTQRHGPVSATPSPAAGPPPAPPPPDPSATTYGDPSGVVLREIERDARHVVLELLTPGFTATPADGGRVRLAIPGFESASGPGKPDLPMRRALVVAAAGRKVRLASVVASDVLHFAGLRPVAEGTPGVEATGDGSVVTSSRRVSEGAAFSGLFPAASARLEGVVFQGETKKANLLLSPLRWDGNSLELSRRLLVRLDFVGREAAETGLGGSQGRRVVARGSHGRRGVVAQLVVKDRGLHRVDYGDVFSGRSEVLASNLRLSRQGESVAFHVEPNPSRFGPGSSLYFLSEGSSLNPYGDAVYELEKGARGMLMPVERLIPDSTPVSEEIATLLREENRYYQAGLLDAPDLWLWDIVVSPASKSYPFTVDHVSSLSPGHVSVSMQGASDFEGVTDHHVKVRVNGVMVGETSWDARLPQTVDAEVGAGILHEGQNTLDLENVGDTGAAYSFVFLNRFSLRYPRTLVATQGTLEGSFTSSGQAAIDGLSSASLLLDTTESPRWLTGGSATASGLSFPVQAGRSYLATSTVLRPQVRRIRAGALKDATNRADYLLLAPKAFLTAAQPLLDWRESQGLVTKAVSLEDVYEQFGHGETSPAAIKEFLEYAYHFWASPSPRYVLLLGDASYDPKDYLKTGVVNWLPGFPVKTSYLWTVSDPAYASVNGNDLVPDVAIGRLPASNAAEADRLVQKVLAFENGGGNFAGPAVLVADNADLAGNFEQDADEIAATILASRNPRKIYYSREGANTRAEIEDAFDQGASFLSYVGHGGTVVWASENIFNYQDVASLRPQSQQPLLLTMNCLNGFFHFPPLNSLSEELLKADGKGVIAAFSPSGLSVNDAAHLYHKAVLQEILSGKYERLGDAILAAQEDYAHTGAFPELLSIYHLFGDPALRIR